MPVKTEDLLLPVLRLFLSERPHITAGHFQRHGENGLKVKTIEIAGKAQLRAVA